MNVNKTNEVKLTVFCNNEYTEVLPTHSYNCIVGYTENDA